MSEPITNVEDAVAALGALPVPQGPEPLALTEAQIEALASAGNRVVNDAVHEHLCMCSAWPEKCVSTGNYYMGAWDVSGLEDALPAVLALWEQMRGGELQRLRARVAALESERHSTNEALDDAVQELRERPALPSRFSATPAEVDAYLRTVLAEDTYLSFQQAIGEYALAEVVEDAGVVRASADNDGLYNADWREGWDDAIERVDPDLCGPSPSKLVEFPAESGGGS